MYKSGDYLKIKQKKILLLIEILNTTNFDEKYNNQIFFKFIIAVILTVQNYFLVIMDQ